MQFYAPWCAHCKRLMPIWEHVGHALADRNSPVRVAKLDCTRYTNVAAALNIRGYPTVILFVFLLLFNLSFVFFRFHFLKFYFGF